MCDLKCSVCVAIVSVIIYLLFIEYVMKGTLQTSNETELWKSAEFLMFISVIVGYNINNMLMPSC
jgi:hypothetical protein